MNVTYEGGTGQQRAWVQEAVAQMAYPWDLLPVNVTVSWPEEPSLPGHSEYMCTSQISPGNYSVEIRRAMDSPDYLPKHPPYDEMGQTHKVDIKRFYIEEVAHEFGHVIWDHFYSLASSGALAAACACFEQRVNGEGSAQGGPGDLYTPPLWGNKLAEGIAETLKDVLLPEATREFDNRTTWNLMADNYDQFMAAMWPSATDAGWGADGETIFDTGSGTPHYEYLTGDHLNVPPDIPINYSFASVLPAATDPDAKFQFRWYVPDNNVISGGAILKYDVWAINSGSPGTGKSYITGNVNSLLAFDGSPQQILAVGDKGLIEVDYPQTIPEGYNAVIARCQIFGSIHSPFGGPFTGWYETSYAIRPPVAPVDVPPFPYPPIEVNAASASWASVRFEPRRRKAIVR